MSSDLEYLTQRRSEILAELPTLSSKVTYTKGNQTFDWNGYRKVLLEELAVINQQISVADGAWEITSRGF